MSNQTISLKDKQTSLLAVLIPYIGYELCTEIIQESEETNTPPIKTLILSKTNLTEEEIAEIFDIEKKWLPLILTKIQNPKKIRKKIGKKMFLPFFYTKTLTLTFSV